MSRKRSYIFSLVLIVLFFTGVVLWTQSAQAESTKNTKSTETISEWQMLWETKDEELSITEVSASSQDKRWFTVKANGKYPIVPEGVTSAWLKLQLPEMTQMRPAIVLDKLYSNDIVMYVEQSKIYELHRSYAYDRNQIVVPFSFSESNKTIYMKMKSSFGRIGLHNEVIVGEYYELFKKDTKNELLDVVIGSSLICISFFMLISILFLNRSFLPGWTSLFLVMLSIGLMILSDSSLADRYFSEYGNLFYYLFDVASTILLPSLFIFFEKIFGKGPYGIISKLNKIQLFLVPISLMLLLLSTMIDSVGYFYPKFSIIYLGSMIVIGNILLIISLIYYCWRGNREALIMAFGLGIFAFVGLTEVIWYFMSDKLHRMYFWKFGVILFLASLIILLVRRIMRNYEQALKYSKQIEIFNNELERSEKIEMISHLAASIAHEVRNPLQVTRGFLQILGKNLKEEKSISYTLLAIEELDRASEIITDFLTFAKPDLEEMMQLDISTEILQIEAILAPLATMQGGSIRVKTEDGLEVKGNSSKFKQALINIIKNSIEAFREDGVVTITVHKNVEKNGVTIRIKDNGEGIDELDLKHLGEPYYSKKTKGTGLGLMVTFRIIEAMQGRVTINSIIGQGTEVCIDLPVYNS